MSTRPGFKNKKNKEMFYLTEKNEILVSDAPNAYFLVSCFLFFFFLLFFALALARVKVQEGDVPFGRFCGRVSRRCGGWHTAAGPTDMHVSLHRSTRVLTFCFLQVSWLVAPTHLSEHASNHPADGEDLSNKKNK
jgi:hypothetical protein